MIRSYRFSVACVFVVMAIAGLVKTEANAEIILADDFADVGSAQKIANTASFSSWDTVNGIVAPTPSLSFFVGDTVTPAGFHDVTDGELDVNNNMTADGWDTSIILDLDGLTTSIDLTTLVLDLRLTNGSGNDNSIGSKSGQMIAIFTGSSSGVLGTADLGGNQAYPSVNYQRTLDLTGLPTLDGSETYTLTLQARGTGFGHHKSLQAFQLNGNLTTVPEPTSLAIFLVGLGAASLSRGRRK